MSKFMLRIYNIWQEEIKELAITPSRGERVSVYGHRNVDPPPSSWLTVATYSSNTGAGISQADLSSAPAHGNKKPARQKIFLKFVIIFHDFHS